MHDDEYIDIIELFDSHLDKFVEDDEVIVLTMWNQRTIILMFMD